VVTWCFLSSLRSHDSGSESSVASRVVYPPEKMCCLRLVRNVLIKHNAGLTKLLEYKKAGCSEVLLDMMRFRGNIWIENLEE
jgi:hypothetical protein